MTPTGKVMRVVDGDTIEVAFKVRLAGVDAPEMKTDEGQKSRVFLDSILPVGSQVSVFHALGETTHGRLVAVVENKLGVNIGEEVIRAGYAKRVWPRPMTLEKE